MRVTRNLILLIIAVVIFAIASVLGFGWLGTSSLSTDKMLAVIALGLTFFAAAHI